MNDEKLLKRIGVVQRKLQAWSEVAEHKRAYMTTVPSNKYLKANLKVERYKNELSHLEELLRLRNG